MPRNKRTPSKSRCHERTSTHTEFQKGFQETDLRDTFGRCRTQPRIRGRRRRHRILGYSPPLLRPLAHPPPTGPSNARGEGRRRSVVDAYGQDGDG
ncbi:hypothetical protein MUK42_36299 [Musa troglodytarum]|uniref:Uncharacterized protein n=1 Tax=Musa troglodytarum TaxID=320322 RepID=A0A9E7EET4_9LILI|nr:hypothetical protein MUK42_36299 [Musa troglodytarum]